MFLLLLTVVIISGLVFRFMIMDNTVDDAAAGENGVSINIAAENDELSPGEQRQLEEQLLLQQYYEAEGVEPLTAEHVWNFVIANADTLSFITMFTVIIAAGIVAGEHTQGTIKLLLIRPVKRWKILLSKWTATMLFSFTMLIALIAFSWIVGLLFFQFNIGPSRWIEVVQGEIRDWHAGYYALIAYGLNFVSVIIMTTFAFMIGTVFRNTSLAIGLSLVAMFTGGQIVYLLSQYDWIKYVLFANTNLIQYVYNNPMIEGMTMPFSITMLSVYFAVFLAIATITFSKRDVAE